MRKTIKNVYKTLVVLLLIIALMIPVFAVDGNEHVFEENSTVDFVLLIDCSTSMPITDKHHLCGTACKMFIDMLPLENARVAVVGFGAKQIGTEYELQSRSYSNDKDKDYVRLLLPMTDVAKVRKDGVDKLKAKIDKSLNQTGGKASPVGASAIAAVDLLENCGATDGNACIIMLSDGENCAEKANFYTDQDMQLDAGKWAGKHNWPIYALQLNADSDGRTTAEWREDLERMLKMAESSGAGGEGKGRYKLENFGSGSKEIANAFLEIFDRFMGNGEEVKTYTINENGRRVVQFEIGELVAEATIVAAGEGVNEIHLTEPYSDTELDASLGNHEADGYILSGEPGRYVCAKLICPKPGPWTAEFVGDKNAEFIMYQCAMCDMDLKLTCSADLEKVIQNKSDVIRLSAKFVYHGEDVHSNIGLFKQKEALLVAKDQNGTEKVLDEIKMSPEEWGYSASITMDYLLNVFDATEGSYDLYAYIEDEMFRNGFKKSNELGPFKTVDEQNSYIGTLENQEGFINSPVDHNQRIDLDAHIVNPDGDNLDIDLVCVSDRSKKFEYEITDNYLYITNCGGEIGEYELLLTVKEPNYDTVEVGKFTLTVREHPFIYEEVPELTLKVHPLLIHKIIGKLFLKDFGPEAEKIELAERFYDPDGYQPIFNFPDLGDLQQDVVLVSFDEELNALSIKAVNSGDAEISFTVSDGFTTKTIPVKVKVITGWGALWEWLANNWLFVAIGILIVLICLAVLSRIRVKGKWEFMIDSGDGDHNMYTTIDLYRRDTIAKHKIFFRLSRLLLGVKDDYSDGLIMQMSPPEEVEYFKTPLKQVFAKGNNAKKISMIGRFGGGGCVLHNLKDVKVTRDGTEITDKKVTIDTENVPVVLIFQYNGSDLKIHIKLV